MRRENAWTVGALLLGIMTSAGAELGPPLLTSVTWPGVDTVWKRDTMYISSVPSEEGLRYAKTQGVQTVIDLREWSEDAIESGSLLQGLLDAFFPRVPSWNQAAVAHSLGLRYARIPVSVEEPTDASVERFLVIVREVNAQNLLVHCDVGGRALAMWAIYLGTVEGYSPLAALAQAEQSGLTHEGLKNFVLAYLQRHAAAS
jgi:protein tyrosine phosphatase (PTP) superfamily phosphohydrolase (DUF442 family)